MPPPHSSIHNGVYAHVQYACSCWTRAERCRQGSHPREEITKRLDLSSVAITKYLRLGHLKGKRVICAQGSRRCIEPAEALCSFSPEGRKEEGRRADRCV